MCGFADLWVTKVVTWGVEMQKMNYFCFGPSWLMVGLWSTAFFKYHSDLTCHRCWVEFVPKLFLEWITLFASNLLNSQFSAICRCQDSYLGTKDLDFSNNPPFAKMNSWEATVAWNLVWSILFWYAFLFYGTYGLGEIRASLIPLAEQLSFLYFKWELERFFSAEGQVLWELLLIDRVHLSKNMRGMLG